MTFTALALMVLSACARGAAVPPPSASETKTSVEILAIVGEPMAGVPDKPPRWFETMLSSNGTAAILGSFDQQSQALWVGKPGALRLLARSGEAPSQSGGEPLGVISLHGIDRAGRVVFRSAGRVFLGTSEGNQVVAGSGMPIAGTKKTMGEIAGVAFTSDSTILVETDKDGAVGRYAARLPGPLKAMSFPGEPTPEGNFEASKKQGERPAKSVTFPFLKGMSGYALRLEAMAALDKPDPVQNPRNVGKLNNTMPRRRGMIWAGRDGTFGRVAMEEETLPGLGWELDLDRGAAVVLWYGPSGHVAVWSKYRDDKDLGSRGLFAGKPGGVLKLIANEKTIVAGHGDGATATFHGLIGGAEALALDEQGGAIFAANLRDARTGTDAICRSRQDAGKIELVGARQHALTAVAGLNAGFEARCQVRLPRFNQRGQAADVLLLSSPRATQKTEQTGLGLYTPGKGWRLLLRGGTPLARASADETITHIDEVCALNDGGQMLVRIGLASAQGPSRTAIVLVTPED